MYKYGMRLRGFSMGCQPMDGFVRREDDNGCYQRKYWDILVYRKPLNAQAQDDYALDYLGRVKE